MKRERDSLIGAGTCKRCGCRTATVSIAACPECGGAIVAAAERPRERKVGLLSLPPMRYQKAYVWLVLVAAFDIVLTWIILALGGREVNALASTVIEHNGLSGIVIYKFCLIVFVVLMCEAIGRRRNHVGRKLAEWAVAVSVIPVVVSFFQLFTGR